MIESVAREDYAKLFREFVEKRDQNIQKTFIKRLWSVHEDFKQNATLSELRMMFFTSKIACSPEGVKLMASFISRIGAVSALRIVQKLIVDFGASNLDCNRYGDVFKTAWKMAENEGNYDLQEEIESNIISVVCYLAIFSQKQHSAKYREILIPFSQEKKTNKNLDAMMTSRLNSCMYRGLSSLHDIVRESAADVFFMFYPLVDTDSDTMKKSFEEQYRIMFDLLNDKSTTIRAESIKKVLKLLGEYWLLIPKDVVRKLMGFIIDQLSRDSVVAVRVAVFEGMTHLVVVPACLNAFEHALKCICPRGINDKSDRVRLVAFYLLNHLKSHKFINVFDIISRDEVIARLDIESVESVRKQIVPIVHLLLPISKDLDENYYRPRINYLIGKSRLAILTYFRLLYPMKIIQVETGIKLIEMLLVWAYRYLRTKDSSPPIAEDSEGYKKSRTYLECALILFSSSRSAFMLDENAKSKTKIEALFAKVVRVIFESYRDTPIMGTATAISSVISKDVLKGISTDVFAMLENDEVPDEAVEAFLESASHFNIDSLFESIDKGLESLAEYVPDAKKSKKSSSATTKSLDKLTKSLRFLKYIMTSHTTITMIATRDVYRQWIIRFADKIDCIRAVIDARLQAEESFPVDDQSLLTALQLRFVLPIFSVANACDDEEAEKERRSLLDSIRKVLKWFNTNIAAKMSEFRDENYDFLIILIEKLFDCISVSFSSWDFSSQPADMQLEDDNENENKENEIDSTITQNTSKTEAKNEPLAELVAKIIVSFCNSSTPIMLYVPILRASAYLCDDEYEECHQMMVSVLKFAPKWLGKHCSNREQNETDENIDEKECSDALRLLYKKVSETKCWTNELADDFAKKIAVLSFACLTDAADEVEYEDPRLHDYIPPQFVTVALKKFVVKEKGLLRTMLKQITELLNAENFIGDQLEENVCMVRLGSVVQLLRILIGSTKEFNGDLNSVLEKCESIAKKYLEGDTSNIENYVKNSIKKLLDLENP